MRLGKDGKGETEIAAGAADFCIVEENGSKEIVYTNGKHIFAVAEGQKRRKLADADFCLKVGGLTSAKTDSDLFDLI